jgi:aryl-alcohol dehydrogenase-like predicted oxidoreductase
LQTDHIDLYQMHHVDRTTPWDEIWQAMQQLIRDGKITYVGSSNFAAWDIATAQATATARHLVGLTSDQSLYNLAKRTVELEVIPALRHLGIGLIAYSPLHAGVLAGVRHNVGDDDAKPASVAQQRVGALGAQLKAYEELCEQVNVEPAHMALAWLLHNPVVAATIVGPTNVDELQSGLRSLAVHLDPETLQRLDEIWPGPGEAPQAYSW